MSFVQTKIHLDLDTIAEQLRTARQNKNLRLEKVSRDLGINIKYLSALEKGRFDLLPKGLYGKNYLIEYSKYLKLDTMRISNKKRKGFR